MCEEKKMQTEDDEKEGKEPPRQKKRGEGIMQNDIVLVQDKENNQIYLAFDQDGELGMLKRVSNKKKRIYHPVWWKKRGERILEKSQAKSPGPEWRLWFCEDGAVKRLEEWGAILSTKWELPTKWDQRYLTAAGKASSREVP